MTATRIKICGVREIATGKVACDAGADMVGFVFVDASPRCVDAATAKRIAATLPSHVAPVALFVDETTTKVSHTLDAIDSKKAIAQLHGHETIEVAKSLRPRRVIKAIHFNGPESIDAIRQWLQADNTIDQLIIDAPPPTDADADMTGGSGQTFDWHALAAALTQLEQSIPDCRDRVVLAGGLTPDNVAGAIRIVRPGGVDVSSGVESSRGVKNHEKIRAFCDAVRQTDQ